MAVVAGLAGDAQAIPPQAWAVAQEGMAEVRGSTYAANPAAPDAAYLYIWMMDGARIRGGSGYSASQADLDWRIQAPR